MKHTKNAILLIAVLILSIGFTGCRKKPVGLTPIPGKRALPPDSPTVFPPESGLVGAGGGGDTGTDAGGVGAPGIDATPVGLSAPGTGGAAGVDLAASATDLTTGAMAETDTGFQESVPVIDENAGTPLPELPVFDGDWEMDQNFFHSNTVYFDFDRSNVGASEVVKIEEVHVYLQGESRHGVLIDGHCDERGTEEYNRALGERRALSVREYLVNLGINPNRIYTRSFGEDMPAHPTNHDQNRRAEFILLLPRK